MRLLMVNTLREAGPSLLGQIYDNLGIDPSDELNPLVRNTVEMIAVTYRDKTRVTLEGLITLAPSHPDRDSDLHDLGFQLLSMRERLIEQEQDRLDETRSKKRWTISRLLRREPRPAYTTSSRSSPVSDEIYLSQAGATLRIINEMLAVIQQVIGRCEIGEHD